MKEVECIVWCPSCKADKYTVYRVPTGNEGVFMNAAEPKDAVAARCQCGEMLERKNV